MRFIFMFLLSLLVGQSAYAVRDFIIDTDAGADDVMAILYLLQRSDINIHAITIIGNGEARCQPAFRNLQGILSLMKRDTIPMACGQETPMAGQHKFPAILTTDQESLSGTYTLLPKSSKTLPKESAVDLLINTLQQSRVPMTILALGPLTNLAQALQQAPQIQRNIKEIYISGGAVRVAGNIRGLEPQHENETAEWNIFIDPTAADIVFKHKLAITLIPLDVTNQLPIDMSFYKKVEANQQSVATTYLHALLKGNLPWIREDNFNFWDPLAAVIASDTSLATFETLPLKIVLGSDANAGTTLLDKAKGRPVRVAVAVNKEKVKTQYLDHLNKPVKN